MMRVDGVRGVRNGQFVQSASERRRPRCLGARAVTLLLFSVLWALLLTTGCNADHPDSAHERYDACEVTRVNDGDTVRVQCDGVDEHVRLLRIDTAERNEPGYVEARSTLEGMIGERPVEIVFETPGKAERDSYGRLLAYLFVEGRNLNVEMVRRCWSYFYTEYGEGRFADDFLDAEAEADCSGELKVRTLRASGFIGPCDAMLYVVDGDTVHVKCRAGEFHKVQLLRSDAPDRSAPGVQSARRALRELLAGREIRFLPEEESAGARQDKYRRWLAYLQDVESGKIINVEMVRACHAGYDTRYGEGRFAEDFAAAQAECEQSRRH